MIVSAVTPAANLSCRLYSLPSAASIPSGGEQTRKGTGDNGNVHEARPVGGLSEEKNVAAVIRFVPRDGFPLEASETGKVDDVAESMGQRFSMMFSANARGVRS